MASIHITTVMCGARLQPLNRIHSIKFGAECSSAVYLDTKLEFYWQTETKGTSHSLKGPVTT